jgi:hypothetical protein
VLEHRGVREDTVSNTGHELVSWTQEEWAAIHEAVERALAATAKCRQVIPRGADAIDEKAVVVPAIAPAPGAPVAYGPDTIATPVHVYVDATLDDQHAGKLPDIIRLLEVAAAQLGVLEDEEIVNGDSGGAATPGREPRNPALSRAAAAGAGTNPPIAIGAGGNNPDGAQLYAAIATAIAALEGAARPGRFGLLVHNGLMATLRQPRVAGGVPLIQEAEALIGSNEIVGTSALDGSLAAGATCGALLRLEPPALDLVQTQLPNVTVLGRAAGSTNLRVEQEFVLQVTDPAAVQSIEY